MPSLYEKIAALFIMGFDGLSLDDHHPAAQWLAAGIGGILLFDKDLSGGKPYKNIRDAKQVEYLMHQIRHYAGHRTPLIAVDYEGGAVDRLRMIEGMPESISPLRMAAMDNAAFDTHVHHMAQALQRLGFNLDFAPVVDLAIEQQQGIIGHMERAFSADAQVVVERAGRFVDIFAEHGIFCCFKHFPGHGSACSDSHEGFVDVSHSFQPDELTPWKQAKSFADKIMIMTAHVINRQLDAEGLPATLSKPMLTGLLRQEYGFEGIIISDDLQMHAIAHHFSLEQSLTMTFNAGADMVIFGNQLGQHDAFELIACVESLVAKGHISEQRIHDAYLRVSAHF